ncbi:unnamed protein product, partial [Brassica oleracea]
TTSAFLCDISVFLPRQSLITTVIQAFPAWKDQS